SGREPGGEGAETMNDQEPDSGSFNKNYKILKETADWLSRQEEPDIDQLVPKVKRAMQAYRLCKDRLGRGKEKLGPKLQGDAPQTGDVAPPIGGDDTARPSRISSSVRDGDTQDLPF